MQDPKKKQNYGTKGAPTSLSKGRSKAWAFTNGTNTSEKKLKIYFIKILRDAISCIGRGNKFFKSGKTEMRS